MLRTIEQDVVAIGFPLHPQIMFAFEGGTKLRPYQKSCSGLHLATFRL